MILLHFYTPTQKQIGKQYMYNIKIKLYFIQIVILQTL